MNLVLWSKGSSGAVPFSTFLALLALWFGVSVPLTFVGAYFGFRKRVSSKCRILSSSNQFLLFDFIRHWSIQFAPIKYLAKYRINRFTRNQYPALLWAAYCRSVAFSFNFSSSWIQFGPVKCTTCSAFCSSCSWFWWSHARKRQSSCAISICALKTTTGGGDHFSRLDLRQSICSFTVATTLRQNCRSRMPHRLSCTLATQRLWCFCSSCWPVPLDLWPVSGLYGKSTALLRWTRHLKRILWNGWGPYGPAWKYNLNEKKRMCCCWADQHGMNFCFFFFVLLSSSSFCFATVTVIKHGTYRRLWAVNYL